jgi:glucose-1-phosphate cytidylyltransferase
VETGESTQTGGRIKRIREHIDDTFCLTYGDGVSDVNFHELIELHKDKQALTTVTAVQPEGRFGALEIKGDFVHRFSEKPVGDKRWISGGFFVCEPQVFDRIEGDSTVWEKGPLEGLAQEGRLAVYRHTGFWAAMDTQRDKFHLEQLWSKDQAPWKVW